MLPVPQPGHTSYAPQGTAASLWGNVTAAWGSSGTTDVPLPTDKLPSSLPCGTEHPPVLLVNCGSFNPPTIMHLRMFDVAAQVLKKAGHGVIGGYMSPVNDAYHKPGLLPAQHRVAMCHLAAAESDLVMVDTWEAAQADAQRSLIVLEHVQQAVQDHYTNATVQDGHQQHEQQNNDSHDSGAADNMQNTAGKSESNCKGSQTLSQKQSGTQVKTMLVCGADVLESFIKPGVWVEEQVRRILGDHGVVCIARNSKGLVGLLQAPGTLLNEYIHNIHVIEDPATAGISSTNIRHELQQGNTVKFLTPDEVIEYIQEQGLYTKGHS